MPSGGSPRSATIWRTPTSLERATISAVSPPAALPPDKQGADDVVVLAAPRAQAGQMRGGQKLGFSKNTRDGRMGALARRAAGAIGHGNEVGREWRKTLDGLPQTALHLLGLRREKLEGDRRGFKRAVPIRRGGRNLGHGTTNST